MGSHATPTKLSPLRGKVDEQDPTQPRPWSQECDRSNPRSRPRRRIGRCGSRRRLLAACPLCVLLRHQRFDSFSQKRVSVLSSSVGACMSEKQILLVPQTLTCRSIEYPIGLQLVELLNSLNHHDCGAERGGDRLAKLRFHRHGRQNGMVAAATMVTIFKILKYLFCCELLWSYQSI